MYAFYNSSTSKFVYLYIWLYLGEDIQYALENEDEGGDIIYTSHDRSVLDKILSNYLLRVGGSGNSITDPEIDPGLLDGFEVVKIGVL